MNRDLEEALIQVFEQGALFGFALSETHGHISLPEVKARARNKYEQLKEEIFGD